MADKFEREAERKPRLSARARRRRQRNGCLAAVAFVGYLALLFTIAATQG